MACLRELPIDELKLDRAFVLSVAGDDSASALVASTVALPHSPELRMVAAGVEDEVADAELARLGSDQAQGDLMSRPLPARSSALAHTRVEDPSPGIAVSAPVHPRYPSTRP